MATSKRPAPGASRFSSAVVRMVGGSGLMVGTGSWRDNGAHLSVQSAPALSKEFLR